MSSAAEDELINAYVVLKDRLSLEDLQNQSRGLRRKQRQKAVVRILKEQAAATQGQVLDYLQTAKAQGAVDRITSIWAINRVAFRGTRSVINKLAQDFVEIERIRYDAAYPEELLIDEGSTRHDSPESPASLTTPTLLQPADPTGSLILINAPQVWAEGDSGQGVLVANIDTGTDWTHPDLANNIWNNLGEDADGDGRTMEFTGSTWVFDPGDINGVDDDGNGYADDFIGWDLQQDDNDPIGGGHGTKISGIVAGDGTGGTQTGVAPKAKLMILKLIFNEHGGESVYWAAEQYALDMGADIITSALSYKWWFSPQPDYAGFRDMAIVELAAGVVHTNSSSNNGNLLGSTAPLPFNISTPGNCPSAWLHPDQTVVGGFTSIIAAGNVNAGSDVIVSNSPYGPSAWEDYTVNHPSYPWTIPVGYRDYPYETNPGSQGLLKPDVSAPGDGTRSTRHGGGYVGFSGTSAASAHLAGTAALLLGANPDLTPADVSRIMQQTAVDKGAPGKDDRYGAGRIDAYQAYLQAAGGPPPPPPPPPPPNNVYDACAATISSGACETSDAGFTGAGYVNTTNSIGVYVEWINVAVDSAARYNAVIRYANGAASRPADVHINGISQNVIDFPTTGAWMNWDTTSVMVDFNAGINTFRLTATSSGGLANIDRLEIRESIPTQVKEGKNAPVDFTLAQNYPNPFNPSTTIEYSLPKAGSVRLRVYNLLGEEVVTLVNEMQEAGFYHVQFDSRDFPSGLYFYRLSVGPLASRSRVVGTSGRDGQVGDPPSGSAGSGLTFVSTKKLLILK
ncbi:MAG: S8 family serine peptidase [Ignavibacteria bacterium]|nr:S8 family serine peptidase [Ignavibacteria bacterium]